MLLAFALINLLLFCQSENDLEWKTREDSNNGLDLNLIVVYLGNVNVAKVGMHLKLKSVDIF